MRDLQHVDVRDATSEQLRIDAFLDVAHQQEPLFPNLAKEHDRDVVDRGAAVGWVHRDTAGIGPQDLQMDRVERQAVARRQPAVRRPERGEVLCPGLEPRTRPDHARLVHAPHAIALEQERETGDVILVRVAEHEDVDPPIPGREPLVKSDEEPRRVGAAIDQHAAAATPLHQDAVALSDIEDHDTREPVGSMNQDEREAEDGDRHRASREPSGARVGPRGHLRAFRLGSPRPDDGRARPPVVRGAPATLKVLHPGCAPSCCCHDHDERNRRGNRVPRSDELEAGKRQAGADPDHGDHRGVDAPCRQSNERRDGGREPRAGEHAGHHRQGARGHRRGHHRDDEQVHERRDER
jgi:hypothetical protein